MQLLKYLSNLLSYLNTPLGSWFGIPVRLHWSWVLVLLLITWQSGWAAAASYVGLFVIVILHELGHCFAARYYDCSIQDIVLYPFGGAARRSAHERGK